MELNEIIRIYRLRNNLKQSEVAEILNLKTSAYSNIESGKTELTVQRLIKMFPILGDEFFNDVIIYIHEKSIEDMKSKLSEENLKRIKKSEEFTEEQSKSILKKSINYRKAILQNLIDGC